MSAAGPVGRGPADVVVARLTFALDRLVVLLDAHAVSATNAAMQNTVSRFTDQPPGASAESGIMCTSRHAMPAEADHGKRQGHHRYGIDAG
jgi:hypothetical protein